MKEKKKITAGSVLRFLVLIAALCVFVYAAYNLYQIYHEYQAGEDEYNNLAEKYVTTPTPAQTAGETADTTDAAGGLVDPEPPITVDFASLQAQNPDIVGWIYVEAVPGINYPILQGEDNEYYLHHTFERVKNTSASIFLDYQNTADFSDSNTIVYGHNMKNGSMFGLLRNLFDQKTFDENPYIWILTPKGNYRYEIFSVYETSTDSATYTLFGGGGQEFKSYLEKCKGNSVVSNEAAFTGEEKAITLSTCTGNDATRRVVQAKCISIAQPVAAATPTPVPDDLDDIEEVRDETSREMHYDEN